MYDATDLTEEEVAAVAAVQEEAKRLAAEYGPNPNYAQLAEGSRRLRDFTEFPGIGPNRLVLESAIPPWQADRDRPEWEMLLVWAARDAWAAMSTEDKIACTRNEYMGLAGRVDQLERDNAQLRRVLLVVGGLLGEASFLDASDESEPAEVSA